MGGGQSLFRREDLEVYEACTCLSGAEILELYEKFVDLGGVREKANAAEKVIRGPGADLAAPEVAGMELGLRRRVQVHPAARSRKPRFVSRASCATTPSRSGYVRFSHLSR